MVNYAIHISGSSGFEHVFVGESKSRKISGFHGWIYFYQEEQNGNLDYYGYQKSVNLGSNMHLVQASLNWKGVIKSSSMFMGTPPELEMALYTICALTRPEKSCPMKFGNKSFSIKVFDQNGSIGSAYPQI